MVKYYRFFLLLFSVLIINNLKAQNKRWTEEKANKWYAQQGWLVGCNFPPSTAINQLEMFQEATFDPKTIDKELNMAKTLGFNTMRVYLHHILWTSDKIGFKSRLDDYLSISNKHGIKTILVFFDDCWNDEYQPGKQPEPKPGIHNSGWVRDPGTMIYSNPDTLPILENYVKDILRTFKDDQRILMWDLYNEPGNSKQVEKSLPLLEKVFAWARAIDITQPITSGVWTNAKNFRRLNEFQLFNSDIITYHNYSYIDNHKNAIDTLKKYNRPLICTEYLARRNGSLFQTIMPLLKKENVGAINWGFVSGKTNTIYASDSPMPNGKEPGLWFHDIFRKDGTAFSNYEVDFIKIITSKK